MNRKPDPNAFPRGEDCPKGRMRWGANRRCLLIPNAQTNAQAQNQMYKCETSDPQAKGYVPSWYIPLFLGRIFRPEKLLLRRKLVKSAKCFSIQKTNCAKSRGPNPCTSVEYPDDAGSAAEDSAGGSAVPSREFAVPMRKSLYLPPPTSLGMCVSGAVFAFLCSCPAKSLPPAPPKLYTGPLLSYNRRDTEIRSAPPAHAAAAPV